MVPRKDIKATLKNITTPSRINKTRRERRDLQLELNKRRNISDSESSGTSGSGSSTTTTTSGSDNSSGRQVIDVTKPVQVQVPRTEKLSPKKASAATGTPLSVIYIEIHSLNDEAFDGTLSKVEAKGLWNALKQPTVNIKRITIKSGKFARIGFELNSPVKLTELSNKPTFNIEFTRGHTTDIYRVKLPDYDTLAYKIGEVASVTVTNTGLETSALDIAEWFSKFGKIIGDIRYKNIYLVFIKDQEISSRDIDHKLDFLLTSGPVGLGEQLKLIKHLAPFESFFSTISLTDFLLLPYRSPVDADGIGTDEWELDLELFQHVPELLPIKGNRSIVYYPGIPKQCKSCFETGHTAPKCSNQKEDYLNYVDRFLKTGQFSESMIGSWFDTLKKYHPNHNRADPNDLRQTIVLNKKGVGQKDLRRKIGPSTDKDLRTNIGNNTAEAESRQEPQGQPFNETRGRGSFRSRGQYRSSYSSRGGFKAYRGHQRGRGNSRGFNQRGRGQNRGRGEYYH